jgi:hypothetical protein
MITLHREPTPQQKRLQAHVARLSLAQLKAICQRFHGTTNEDFEAVFDACLARIGSLVSESEFTAFCQSLPAEQPKP